MKKAVFVALGISVLFVAAASSFAAGYASSATGAESLASFALKKTSVSEIGRMSRPPERSGSPDKQKRIEEYNRYAQELGAVRDLYEKGDFQAASDLLRRIGKTLSPKLSSINANYIDFAYIASRGALNGPGTQKPRADIFTLGVLSDQPAPVDADGLSRDASMELWRITEDAKMFRVELDKYAASLYPENGNSDN